METQVRTPQAIFMQPQRLVVPLFQRPYVWNEENQWEPLWDDIVRVANRLLGGSSGKQHPHFLGAVVLQQVPRELCGEMGDGGVRRRRIVAVAKTARTSRRSDTPWRRLLPLSHSARSIRSMIH